MAGSRGVGRGADGGPRRRAVHRVTERSMENGLADWGAEGRRREERLRLQNEAHLAFIRNQMKDVAQQKKRRGQQIPSYVMPRTHQPAPAPPPREPSEAPPAGCTSEDMHGIPLGGRAPPPALPPLEAPPVPVPPQPRAPPPAVARLLPSQRPPAGVSYAPLAPPAQPKPFAMSQSFESVPSVDPPAEPAEPAPSGRADVSAGARAEPSSFGDLMEEVIKDVVRLERQAKSSEAAGAALREQLDALETAHREHSRQTAQIIRGLDGARQADGEALRAELDALRAASAEKERAASERHDALAAEVERLQKLVGAMAGAMQQAVSFF